MENVNGIEVLKFIERKAKLIKEYSGYNDAQLAGTMMHKDPEKVLAAAYVAAIRNLPKNEKV